MRLSNRLLVNAFTTYLRLGTTFLLGLFTTWYILGRIGVVGFSAIALAASSTGISHALERALRFGLVRELAAASASGDPAAMRRSLASSMRLCRQAAALLSGVVALLAILASLGVFNLPSDLPALRWALVALILGEGAHSLIRLLGSPYLQSLFAAQHVATDNLLIVLARVSNACSAVIVFGGLFPEAALEVQLIAFSVSRCTIQVIDVAIGIGIARRRIPGARYDPSAYDEAEYRSVRHTVWHSSQVTLLINLNPQFLAILINLFFGLTYNGIWQIVVQFSGFARMFCEGLLRGIEPLVTHLQKSGHRAATRDLLIRSIRYQLAITLPTVLLMILWVQPLLSWWVGDRLAGDAHLAAAGISVSQALNLASMMAILLLVYQTLRAGFFGVERILYGLGEVDSYAWFSKWATLIAVGSGALMMAWFRDPVAAPIAQLVAYAIYSPGIVLRAARRTLGLPLGSTLQRALPRPLLATGCVAVPLIVLRTSVEPWTPRALLAVLAGTAVVYGLLAVVAVLEPDERERLFQLTRRSIR